MTLRDDAPSAPQDCAHRLDQSFSMWSIILFAVADSLWLTNSLVRGNHSLTVEKVLAVIVGVALVIAGTSRKRVAKERELKQYVGLKHAVGRLTFFFHFFVGATVTPRPRSWQVGLGYSSRLPSFPSMVLPDSDSESSSRFQ